MFELLINQKESEIHNNGNSSIYANINTIIWGIPFTDTVIRYLRVSIWDLCSITSDYRTHPDPGGCVMARGAYDEDTFDDHVTNNTYTNFEFYAEVYRWRDTCGIVYMEVRKSEQPLPILTYCIVVTYKNEPKIFNYLYKRRFAPFYIQIQSNS